MEPYTIIYHQTIGNSKRMVKKTKTEIIYRGGTDTERLYLSNLKFKLSTGQSVVVKKTRSNIKGYSMADHIARHKGRYGLIGLFARPNLKILDFPCGSGYASEFLSPLGIKYQGLDNDLATIAYANRLYSNKNASFAIGNLAKPELKKNYYDITACIEGLEHIEKKYQSPLIKKLAQSTKPGGVIIISSPINPTGKSGPSIHNKDHKWELSKKDFLKLLHKHLGKNNIEIVTQVSKLSTGITTVCLYAVCHKKTK